MGEEYPAPVTGPSGPLGAGQTGTDLPKNGYAKTLLNARELMPITHCGPQSPAAQWQSAKRQRPHRNVK
jgi:hypothetical protein